MENTAEAQSTDKRTKRLKVVLEVEFDIPIDWSVGPVDPGEPLGDCLHVGDRAYIPVLTWMKLAPKQRCRATWVEVSSDEEEVLNAGEILEETWLTIRDLSTGS